MVTGIGGERGASRLHGGGIDVHPEQAVTGDELGVCAAPDQVARRGDEEDATAHGGVADPQPLGWAVEWRERHVDDLLRDLRRRGDDAWVAHANE